jgi:hypothetical protein
MIAKLKTEEELQVALDSLQVLSNDNGNNELICDIEIENGEDEIIEKQTITRQTSIDLNRKVSLNILIKYSKNSSQKNDRSVQKTILSKKCWKVSQSQNS